MGRIAKRLVHITVFIHAVPGAVGPRRLVQDDLVGDRLLGIHHGIQHLVIDIDQLAGIHRNRRGSRGNGRYGLALEDDLVDGQRQIADLVARRRAKLHEGIALRKDVLAGQHAGDARQGFGRRSIDAEDARMRTGRAEDIEMQHAGAELVIGEKPMPAHQALVFLAPQGGSYPTHDALPRCTGDLSQPGRATRPPGWHR